jgi:hypothetical protein
MTWIIKRVTVTPRGHAAGETNGKGKRHSNDTVAAVRSAHELLGIGKHRLARHFGVPVNTLKTWIRANNRRRATVLTKTQAVRRWVDD